MKNKRKMILLFSLFMITVSSAFLHPLTDIFGNVEKDYSSIIGSEVSIIIPEPLLLLLVGLSLIGLGALSRKIFRKQRPV